MIRPPYIRLGKNVVYLSRSAMQVFTEGGPTKLVLFGNPETGVIRFRAATDDDNELSVYRVSASGEMAHRAIRAFTDQSRCDPFGSHDATVNDGVLSITLKRKEVARGE
jgi:hypothetical protein